MEIDIITKADLDSFRKELIEEFKQLIKPQSTQKEWLRSSEARKILNISSGTLQNLRINGTLHPVKMPGTKLWYYRATELKELLDKNDKIG